MIKNIKPKFKIGDTMRTLQEAADNITDGLPVVVSIDNEYYHCNNELIAIKDQNNYEYPPMNRIQKPAAKSVVEIWKDMRFEVYAQTDGNRHEPNYSDNSTKMFSLNDIDEIIEKISEQLKN